MSSKKDKKDKKKKPDKKKAEALLNSPQAQKLMQQLFDNKKK